MAPPRNTDFKIETYQRLTAITKTRLDNIKGSLDSLINQSEPLTNVQIKKLNAYSAEAKRKTEDFETNFQRVLTIDDDTLDTEKLVTDQNDINELYIYISSNIESLCSAEEPAANSNNSIDNGSLVSSHSQVRLPKIDLPKFSGNLTTWTSFINLFDATIHNNSSLSDVMRFQYLISALDKEPLSLIRSLNITSHNYAIAYNLLRDRYHNNRRLQILHLNNLLDLPQISSSHIQGVRWFVNDFNENVQALNALDCEIQDSNALLVAVLLRKLDTDLRRKLEAFRTSASSLKHTLPTVKEIMDFLNIECTQLEDATLAQSVQSLENDNSHSCPKPVAHNKACKHVNMITTQVTSLSNVHGNTPVSCFACNQTSHKIYSCPIFKAKTPQERFQIVKKCHQCVSCLGTHDTKTCKSQSNCKICNKRHHTLLHFNNATNHGTYSSTVMNSKATSLNKHSSEFPIKPETSVTLASQNQNEISSSNSTVVLGTLLVQISTPGGNSHVFRALLDSGSMCNLITERAANLLHIRRHKSNIQLSGIDHHVTNNKGQIVVDIKTLAGHTIATDQPTLILDRLTVDLPRMQLTPDVLKRTNAYLLADPTFHVPNRVDLVLGGAIFPQLFTKEQFSLGHNMPYAVGTHFGFVIMGNAPCLPFNSGISHVTPTTTLNVCLHSSNDFDLHSSIQRFWLQEEPPACSIKTHEESLCDKHFMENHTRDIDGRYIVRLPFKNSSNILGESKTTSELRLYAMERKFSSNPHFSELYHDFMEEYLSLGHMSECNDIDLSQPHYFLPHHGIVKECSNTPKLRTVFDASCKTSSGLSLNEILLTGPKMQNNICDLLLQFRLHNIVFCCDIRQMYRQILIHPDDRNFQLILWRSHTSQSPSIYKLNTVTYGMNSSPYLAIKTLHQLADDHGNEFPHAAHVLLNHTYVDDIISGADTESEALALQTQLISLLNRGCFELRKWVSNSPQLLCNIPDTHLETPKFLKTSDIPHVSVLGIQWSPAIDAFSYDFQTPNTHKPPTKRSVLSAIAQIYDPCGFLVPFIMLAKCFMQLIWTKGLSWDSPLPFDLQTQWQSFTDNFKWLSDINIPRSLNLFSTSKIELHGFCDASEVGYAAVTYLRVELPNQSISISLLMAKGRVAPLKRVTIPRLELCAAHLLAQIVSHIKNLFSDKLTSNNIYLWCDSTIALTWLQTPPYRLKTYVANRVSQTQELVPTDSWRHISSGDNPADCGSRGILMSHLIDHKLWWNGPSWLSLPSSNWPTSKFTPVALNVDHELKLNNFTILTTTSQEEWSPLMKFSSWITLTRTMAYVLRFIRNCCNLPRQSGHLTSQELHEARLKIFALLQRIAFPEELKLLTHNQVCPKRFQRLNPFIDSNGLIRVGGRLTNTSLPYDARHPIVLPKQHHVVNILIDYYHFHHLHAGPQLVQAMLSRDVWIICARNVIRSRIHKCITCFKLRPKTNVPLMGELPSVRVNPSKPFSSTGIDYGGPYNIKMLHLRFIKLIKVYICIFVCMVTKAVHIEVVTDLTTSAFIAALTRFTARRGLCTDIYSDCGTTFVGANTELSKIVKSTISCNNSQDQIQRYSSNQGIRFHFNPPAAPHQGGLWESAIKGTKYHLQRVMGNTTLTLPELITLTIRIESMLNSRPLTPLSSDPSDFSALTPGHFLTGAPLVSIPERDLTDVSMNRLKRWQLTQQMFQIIWRRWTREYLHTLQQRSKWITNCQNLKIGDLVLINSPSSPLHWPLGRVVEVFPGRDGIVRVAKVKTSTNTFVRSVIKLCPLPNI